MSITQETIILNEFGLSERRRTTSRGTKSRYTVSIKADAIPHIFDAQELGRKPAEAIAAAIKKGIQAIGQEASLRTQFARKYAKTAFAAGKAWAMERYSGGRTGPTPPGEGNKLFNDSGRLAGGIYVQAVGDESWTVNWPANRFDPAQLGAAVAQTMFERLQALVPALRGGEGLASDPDVKSAIESSAADIIQTTQNQNRASSTRLAREAIGLVRQLAAGLDLI